VAKPPAWPAWYQDPAMPGRSARTPACPCHPSSAEDLTQSKGQQEYVLCLVRLDMNMACWTRNPGGMADMRACSKGPVTMSRNMSLHHVMELERTLSGWC
jgi:hypothetical protein